MSLRPTAPVTKPAPSGALDCFESWETGSGLQSGGLVMGFEQPVPGSPHRSSPPSCLLGEVSTRLGSNTELSERASRCCWLLVSHTSHMVTSLSPGSPAERLQPHGVRVSLVPLSPRLGESCSEGETGWHRTSLRTVRVCRLQAWVLSG